MQRQVAMGREAPVLLGADAVASGPQGGEGRAGLVSPRPNLYQGVIVQPHPGAARTWSPRGSSR